MTETEQTLRQRFTAFLQAMYDWETEANRLDEEEVEKKKTLSWEDFCKQQTELRIPIYKGYITERERKYGGAQYTSHCFPPNYDPSKESITEVQITGKKASIFTDREYARMNYKREYKYKLVEDRWLLDTIKEQYLPENRDPEKWKSVII
ncbi:NTF2 fold immunity protein [Capnocytophaga granulosa]|uniref:NTF2 fold immunity protein n=1 Tax=Capnocytophaga granulosa TaxID=45242 RepID=UPI003622C89F